MAVTLVLDRSPSRATRALDDQLLAIWRSVTPLTAVSVARSHSETEPLDTSADVLLPTGLEASKSMLADHIEALGTTSVVFRDRFELAGSIQESFRRVSVVVIINDAEESWSKTLDAGFGGHVLCPNAKVYGAAKRSFPKAKVLLAPTPHQLPQRIEQLQPATSLLLLFDSSDLVNRALTTEFVRELRASVPSLSFKALDLSMGDRFEQYEELQMSLESGAVCVPALFSPAYRSLLLRAIALSPRVYLTAQSADLVGLPIEGFPSEISGLVPQINQLDADDKGVLDLDQFTDVTGFRGSLLKAVKVKDKVVEGCAIASTKFSATGFDWMFNRQTRLLTVLADVHYRGPESDVAGDFSASTEEVLANAWVNLDRLSDRSSEALSLSGDVVLPAHLEPEDITMSIDIQGEEVLRVSPPTDLPFQSAGLIALQAKSGGAAEVTVWTDTTEAGVQLGTQWGHTDDIDKDGEVRVATLGFSWPPERNTLQVSPANGVGQKVGSLSKFLAPDQISSARIEDLKDCHKGETAWIIGNGPSVRLEDLNRLHGRLSFAFNRFHLSYGDTTFRPSYVVSGDDQMIRDFGEAIVTESECPVFLSSEKVPTLAGDYLWVRQTSVFPSLFSKNPARCVTPGGSSLYVAFQLAYWMGVRKFYLYGTDFSFVMKRNREATDAFRSATGDGNHFIKNYRSGKPWCPPSFRNICSSFIAARELMASEGGFIRNATHGGALEVFEREDFDSALHTSEPSFVLGPTQRKREQS